MYYSMNCYNSQVYYSQEEKRKKKIEEEKQRKEERERKRKEQEECIKNMRKPNFVITKHSDGEKTGEVRSSTELFVNCLNINFSKFIESNSCW